MRYVKYRREYRHQVPWSVILEIRERFFPCKWTLCGLNSLPSFQNEKLTETRYYLERRWEILWLLKIFLRIEAFRANFTVVHPGQMISISRNVTLLPPLKYVQCSILEKQPMFSASTKGQPRPVRELNPKSPKNRRLDEKDRCDYVACVKLVVGIIIKYLATIIIISILNNIFIGIINTNKLSIIVIHEEAISS